MFLFSGGPSFIIRRFSLISDKIESKICRANQLTGFYMRGKLVVKVSMG